MARHLRAKGSAPFIVYDLNRKAVEQFRAESGASVESASSPAELASRASVIVTVLPESTHDKEAYLGEARITRGVCHGALCIDSTTIDTPASIDVTSQVIAAGARAVDAPMGKDVVRCGDLGVDQAAKICNKQPPASHQHDRNRRGDEPWQAPGSRPKGLGINHKHVFGTDGAGHQTLLVVRHCWSSDTANLVPGAIATAPSTKEYNDGCKPRLTLKHLGLVSNAAKDLRAPLMLGALAENAYRHLANDASMAGKGFGIV
ncbi:hypothetical protein GGF44_005315, partial [Coemansia sp. RSA 1694]